MNLRGTSDHLTDDTVAHRPLAIYTNGSISSALAQRVNGRREIDVIPYIEFPELASHESDVIVIFDKSSFSAAAALVDEILLTRAPGATVELVFSSLPDEVEEGYYSSQLRHSTIKSINTLDDLLVATITRSDGDGDLGHVLWQLARSIKWLQLAASRGLADAAPGPAPSAADSEVASITSATDAQRNTSGSYLAPDRDVRSARRSGAARRASDRKRQVRRRSTAALVAAVAVVAGSCTAAVADNLLVTTIIFATFSLGSLVIATAIVVRRAILAVGRRIARLEKTVAKFEGRTSKLANAHSSKLAGVSTEVLHLRRVLGTLHSDLRFSKSQNAILLETLGDRIRRVDAPASSHQTAQ